MTTDVTMTDSTGIDGAEVRGHDDGGGAGAGRSDGGREAVARAPHARLAVGEQLGLERQAQRQVSAQMEQAAGGIGGGEVVVVVDAAVGAGAMSSNSTADGTRVRAIKGAATVQSNGKVGKATKQQVSVVDEDTAHGQGARITRAAMARTVVADEGASQPERADWSRGFDFDATRASGKGAAAGSRSDGVVAAISKGRGAERGTAVGVGDGGGVASSKGRAGGTTTGIARYFPVDADAGATAVIGGALSGVAVFDGCTACGTEGSGGGVGGEEGGDAGGGEGGCMGGGDSGDAGCNVM